MRELKVIGSGSVLFLLVLLFVLITPSSSAQQDVCCVTELGCEAVNANGDPIQPQDCTGTYYISQSCLSLEQPPGMCEQGCCCFNDAGQNYQSAPGIRYACVNPNLYFVGAPLGADCALECSQNFVTVSGQVYYNDGSPADAEVIFTDQVYSTLVYTVSTDSNGVYEIVVQSNTDYDVLVRASHDFTCNLAEQLNVLSSSISNYNHDLPCDASSGGGGTSCTDSWYYAFSNQPEQCGDVTGVTYTGDCTPPQGTPFYQVGDHVPCIPPPILCGNGLWDPGEECDLTANEFLGFCVDVVPQPDPPYTFGQLTCTSQCTLSESQCLTCPTSETLCSLETCDCTICQDVAFCQQASQCSGFEELVLLQPIPLASPDNGFFVEWSIDSPCGPNDVVRYDLYGCNDAVPGVDCQTSWPSGDWEIPRKATIPSTITSVSDTGFSPTYDGRYCYRVTAKMQLSLGILDKESEIKCAVLKKNVCSDVPGEGWVCDGNAIVHCVDGIPVDAPEDCPSGKVCVNPSGVHAECFGTDVCDFCNGPFGMFGYLASGTSIKDTDYFLPLQNLNIGHSVNDCQDVIDVGVCFSDDYSLAKSSIGQIKACSEVSTCYDYRTQYSCESSPCASVTASNCEWNNLYGDSELGIGVCRPIDIAEQECSQCDDNSILGACPEDLCNLHGSELEPGLSRCYYNNEIKPIYNRIFEVDKGICINYESVGCETYDTRDECEGTPSQPFDVDIKYIGEKDGTNAINVLGNDIYSAYGKGRCYWNSSVNGGRCLKDADNSRTDGSIPLDEVNSDCEDNDDEKCLLDMEPPVTTLFIEDGGHYSKQEIANMNIMVEDNSYFSNTGDELKTLFFVENLNIPYFGNEYPKFTLEEIIPQIDSVDPYRLTYFSKDFSENHEQIREVSFNLIFDLDFDIISNLISIYLGGTGYGPDVYQTNLTVQVNYLNPPPNPWLQCSSTLNSSEDASISFIGLGDGTKLYPNLNWLYESLFDGNYLLTVSCIDNHYQELQKEKTIHVDADPTLSDPLPRGATYNTGTVDLSIKTIRDATCYYLDNDIYVSNYGLDYIPPDKPFIEPANFNQADWVQYNTDNSRTHYKEIGTGNGGFHKFFSYCDIGGSNYFGNYGDMAYFAVDKQAPLLDILDAVTDELYNHSGPPTTEVTLKFVCNDIEILNQGIDYSFGCHSLLVCSYETGSRSCNPDQVPTLISDSVWTHVFSSAGAGSRTTIVMTVNDTGNNSRDYHMDLTTLRDLLFEEPEIIICDPDRGIPCDPII